MCRIQTVHRAGTKLETRLLLQTERPLSTVCEFILQCLARYVGCSLTAKDIVPQLWGSIGAYVLHENAIRLGA